MNMSMTRSMLRCAIAAAIGVLSGAVLSPPPVPLHREAMRRSEPRPRLVPAAQAVPVRVTVDLEYNGIGFAAFVQQAEALIQEEVDDRFNNDITVSRISLIVNGRNIGLTAPILSIELDRGTWQRNRNITQHARYYPDSRTLLRITEVVTPEEPELGTGDVQVSLRWTGTDDLDLAVSDPDGTVVFYGNPQAPSGGILDLDSNAGCGSVAPVPVENVFWPFDGAPSGNYEAAVNLFSRCDRSTTAPIAFTLTILVNGQSQTYSGQVSDAEPTLYYPFTVGEGE